MFKKRGISDIVNSRISYAFSFSEIIENSDVFANEDLEYIVQAERNQEPYFR